MGVNKVEMENHVKNVFKGAPFKDCDDLDALGAQAVQEMCGCMGDLSCACPIFNQAAGQCNDQGVNADGWQLKRPESKCTVECPEGSVFKERGPKPAPSCAKPHGGGKSQPGCFCSEGQVMEDGACVSVDTCKCEYEGKLYGKGEKYNKPNECLGCTCDGQGKEICEAMTCNPRCNANEVEVEEDGECCPQCVGNWVTAVNPEPETEPNEAVNLVCEVNGVEVAAADVKWYRDPGMEKITNIKKSFSFSDDRLTLTIKSMDAKKEGRYKCVVEKDGKTSKGVFKVALPPPDADLVEAKEEKVAFVEGQDVSVEVSILYGEKRMQYVLLDGKTRKSPAGVLILLLRKMIVIQRNFEYSQNSFFSAQYSNQSQR